MNELGKIPPQAIDFEKAVLGALLLEKNKFFNVMTIISENSFYNDNHKIIYKAIIALNQENKPIDIITVTEKLRELEKLKEVGGAYYITQLTSRITSAASIEYHATIVQQKFLQREIIRICSQAEEKAFDNNMDIEDLFAYLENELIKISLINNSECKTFYENVKESIDNAIKRKNDNIEFTGLDTGSKELNSYTGGWQNGEFILLAGRPSMGKTAMALHYALHTAKKKHVLYFSLEMSAQRITDRLITGYLNMNPDQYKSGQFENEYIDILYESEMQLGEHKLHIYDDKFKLNEIIAISRQKKLKNECDIIFIDYLGLINPGNRYKGNKVNEIGEISRSIKQLAGQLKVPIIALHQLNRDVERRADHIPQLADLRDSGDLEQDADMVIFLLREDYYNRFIPFYEKTNEIQNIIAKQRDGRLGVVTFKHNQYINKFFEDENEIPENNMPF